MRKRSFFKGMLYTLLLLVFFLSAYKVVNGYTSAKKEQEGFEALYALVAQNTADPLAQNIREEPPSASQSSSPMIPQEDSPSFTRQPALQKTAVSDNSSLAESEEKSTVPVILPQYATLYETNPDFFGWLTIEGTVIDYPVMHTPDDPERYMRRAFDGSYSSSGVPFLDGNCPADGNYYLVYGHHMRNGTMFGHLPDYQDEGFWTEHSIVRFDTLYEQREYVAMAAFFSQIYGKEEKGVFRYYEYFDLPDQATFDEYTQQVRAVALYDTGIDAEYGDELLVLSTCHYHTSDGRFVVVAKRIK